MDVSDEDALSWAQENSLGPGVNSARARARARAVQAPAMPAPFESDSGPIDAFLSSAYRSFAGLAPGTEAILAAKGGDEEAYDIAQRRLEEVSLGAHEIAPDLVSQTISNWDEGDIVRAYEEDGAIGAAAKTVEFGAEQIGHVLGTMSPELVAGAVAGGGLALAGAPLVTLGALTAATGVAFFNFLSRNMERAYSEGSIDTEDISVAKTLSASGAQAVLNQIPVIASTPIGRGLSAGLSRVFLKSAAQTAARVDRVAKGSPIKSIAKGVFTEEVTEFAQTALERMQAGLSMDPREEEAAAEYLDVAFMTLFPSAVFGGTGAVTDARARSKLLGREGGAIDVHKERVETFRALDRIAKEEQAAALEDSMQRNLAETEKKVEESAPPDATPEDIHNLADERNILWDEDLGFMAFTKRVTGYYRIDDIADKPELMNVLRKQLSAAPIQDSPSNMQMVTDKEVIEIARHLPKGKGKNITREDVSNAFKKASRARGDKKTVGLLDSRQEGLSKDLADQIIDTSFFKLTDMGHIRQTAPDPEVDGDIIGYELSPQMEEVSIETYENIINDSLESGFFPSNEQLAESHGIDSSEKYNQIFIRALELGDIEKAGDRYVPYVPDYTDDVQGYRISINGEIQPTWYETRADAARAKKELFKDDSGVRGSNIDLIAGSVTSEAEASRRAGRPLPSSWGMPSDRLKTVPTDEVVIVDNPKTSPDPNYVSREFTYEVEKLSSRWVVNDRDGNIVKGFRSKSEANKFVENRKENSFSWDLVVNGEVIESHATRGDARKALPAYKNRIKKALFDAHKTDLLRGDLSDKVASREAKALSESESRSYFRKYVPSVAKREVDPGLTEAGKGTIYAVKERRTGGSGKITKFRNAGLFNTEEEAQVKKGEFEKGRIGRESVAGKLIEPVDPTLVAEVADAEAVVDVPTPPVPDIPPPTQEQVAFRKAVSNKIKSGLRGRGLGAFNVNIVESINQDGASASFNESMNAIEIALDPYLLGLSKVDEVVAALAPKINHESFHGFEKLGLVKPNERSQLSKKSRSPIPEAHLKEINSDLVEAGNAALPIGSTYMDLVNSTYGAVGDRRAEVAKIDSDLEQGKITQEEADTRRDLEESQMFTERDYESEAIASVIEGMSMNPDVMDPPSRTVLRRIADAMIKLKGALTGMGYTDPEAVFRTLFGESMDARMEAGKALDLYWTRRPLLSQRGAPLDVEMDLFRAREKVNDYERNRDVRKESVRLMDSGLTPEEAQAKARETVLGVEKEEGVEFGFPLPSEEQEKVHGESPGSPIQPPRETEPPGPSPTINKSRYPFREPIPEEAHEEVSPLKSGGDFTPGETGAAPRGKIGKMPIVVSRGHVEEIAPANESGRASYVGFGLEMANKNLSQIQEHTPYTSVDEVLESFALYGETSVKGLDSDRVSLLRQPDRLHYIWDDPNTPVELPVQIIFDVRESESTGGPVASLVNIIVSDKFYNEWGDSDISKGLGPHPRCTSDTESQCCKQV
mgnify:FL=1